MKVGILGTGNVARNLAEGLVRAGHSVAFGSRDPSRVNRAELRGEVVTQADAARFGDIVILAIPFGAVPQTLRTVGPAALKGKVLVDATNALAQGSLAVGFTTSAAEETAKLVPDAKVVKAFNTVFAATMKTGRLGDTKLTTFVAGDDKPAKESVMRLAADIGFDALDAGPLRSARFTEPMAAQLIHLAYVLGMGTNIGLALARG